jgi:glutamate synthase domain-containing protein 2
MVALGCNQNVHAEDYHAIGAEPGACHHCHTGRCPVGITTQIPELEARLDPEQGARRLRNYLNVMTMEVQTLARACGKSHVLNLEPEDLAAMTVEAAAMAKVPLAGTDWIPGGSGGDY